MKIRSKAEEQKATLPSVLVPPVISAKAWAIADGNSGKVLIGYKENEKREIASLTKIMTATVSIALARRFGISFDYSKITISAEASRIGGTSANLLEGDQLYLFDLLHGLMLPSGNDAAYALAEYFGQMIQETLSDDQMKPLKLAKSIKKSKGKNYNMKVNCFLLEMNQTAKNLGLTQTHFANPHGLKSCSGPLPISHYSSAEDLSRLCSHAMKDIIFRQIVKCQKYSCSNFDIYQNIRYYNWENTNKLLQQGFNGLKTGVTTPAGPCLAASIEIEKEFYIFILLRSSSMEARWSEVMTLLKWVRGALPQLQIQSSNHLRRHSMI